MHCYGRDFSVLSILPPFNVVHSQVILRGYKSKLLTNTTTKVMYSATADSSGSLNCTNIDKANFWDFLQQLFGLSRPEDLVTCKACMRGYEAQRAALSRCPRLYDRPNLIIPAELQKQSLSTRPVPSRFRRPLLRLQWPVQSQIPPAKPEA